jgi:hypothetical protein
MGANVSNQLAETVNSTVNKTVNSITKTASASSSNTANSNQSISIKGSKIYATNFSSSQSSTIKLQTLQTQKADMSTKIGTAVHTELKTKVAQLVDQANKDLNLGQVNVSNTVTRITNKIQNITENNVTSNINSFVKSAGSSGQNFTIDSSVFHISKDMKLNQSSILNQLSNNISNAIVSDAISTATTSKVATEIKQKATQKNTGININFLGAIAGIVAVIGGGGLAAKYMKDKKGKKGKSGNMPEMSSIVESKALGVVGGSVTSALKNNWKLISGLIVVITILILMVYFFYVKPKIAKNKELIKFAETVPADTTYDTLDKTV